MKNRINRALNKSIWCDVSAIEITEDLVKGKVFLYIQKSNVCNYYGMWIIMVCVTIKCELLWYVLLQKSPDLSIMICITIMICVNTPIMICVFPSTHIGDMCVMFCLPHVVCAWKFLLMKCAQTFHKSNHTIMICVTHFIICAEHIMKCVAQIIVVWPILPIWSMLLSITWYLFFIS